MRLVGETIELGPNLAYFGYYDLLVAPALIAGLVHGSRTLSVQIEAPGSEESASIHRVDMQVR